MNKMILSLIFITASFLIGNVSAQKKIIPGSNHLLKNDLNLPVVEPYLAINPSNGNHMVAAAIVYDSAATSDIRTHIVVFATKNNGKTWKQTHLPMTVGFDPWVAIRNEKQVALVGMISHGSGHRTELIYYNSSAGGFTWSEKGISLGGSHDHPTLAIDKTKNNRLYVYSNQGRRNSTNLRQFAGYMNYSDDWKTFQDSAAYFFPAIVNNNTLTAVVNSRGTVLLPYIEFTVADNEARTGSISLVYSKDGRNLSEPVLITDRCAVGKGFPVMAVATEGAFKDRAYMVKNSGSIPARSEGLFVHFSDDYKSWSEEVRVDHNSNNEKFMRTAAIGVNKNGVVGISWVDRRNDTGLKKNDIYFTVSVDGGKTFQNEVRVTSVNSDPLTPVNGKAGQRHFSGGDYMACVPKPDGSFQLLWADNRSGIFELYTANVAVK